MNILALQPQGTVPPAGGAPTTTSSTAQPSTPASSPSSSQTPGGQLFFMLAMIVPLFLVMWLTSRSQTKKQKELEAKLKKGDRVVTQSGLVGKLLEIGAGRHVKIEIAPGVKVDMLRTAIVGLDTEDAAPGVAPDKK